MTALSHKVVPNRLGALIDGIFAIVMTILVLDIKVPHDIHILKNLTLEEFLTGQFQDILVYMTAFILLGYIWVMHHSEAHAIKLTDRRHVWISILFLMFVALVPFSSALVNRFPIDEIAAIFLAANIFIIAVLNYYSWAYATKGRHLVDEKLTDGQIAAEKRKLMVLPAVSLLAIAIALVCPIVSSYSLLIAPIVITMMENR